MAAILAVTSCKKEETHGTYYAKCKIDGVDFEATTITYTNPYSNGYIIDISKTGYPHHLMFNVSDDTTGQAPVVGVKNLNSSSSYIMGVMDVGFASGGWSSTYSGSGSINVTEVTSANIRGTFNSLLYHYYNASLKTVTGGEFNIQRN